MNSQEFRALQEAYMEVVENQQLDELSDKKVAKTLKARERRFDRSVDSGAPNKEFYQLRKSHQAVARRNARTGSNVPVDQNLAREEVDIYDIILSHLLDEGYAETPEAAEAIMVNMSEDWRQDIMEKEDSEYEKASDAALDSRYGYGRASGDKRSFGRAANRSSAAAALRAIRRGERSGSGTSREAGSDAVHKGWAKTAKTSTDQTPEKKERRAGLANTPYSKLPDDEKEKDRVSFDAVRATYNKNKKPYTTSTLTFELGGFIMSGERGISTVGSASALQVGSQEFESPILHL